MAATQAQKDRIRRLRSQGYTNVQIQNDTGCDITTIIAVVEAASSVMDSGSSSSSDYGSSSSSDCGSGSSDSGSSSGGSFD